MHLPCPPPPHGVTVPPWGRGGGGSRHAMVALKLQWFQYNPEKILLRRLVFPMLFGPIYSSPTPGGGGGGLQRGGGGFKGGSKVTLQSELGVSKLNSFLVNTLRPLCTSIWPTRHNK